MRRLGDLGFYPGRRIVLMKRSMLEGSVLIDLEGVDLILRSDLADKIIVGEQNE